MADFYWDQDSNIVSADAANLNPVDFAAARGQRDIRLFVRMGGVETLLAVDQTVGLIIRDPANLDVGYLGGPTLLTRGATAADGYLGLTSTDTTFTRQVTHVDDPNTPELLTFPASAVFYYVPTAGGDAIESLPFNWSILPAYYRTTQPPADIVANWPSAATLTAVVAEAGSKEPGLGAPAANCYILFSNTDKTRSWGPPTFTLPVIAPSFAGDGAAVTNLNASHLGSGTVDPARLPADVAASLHFKGAWDAAANNPALASGAGEKGAIYVVGTSGTTTLDGVAIWRTGDFVINDGAHWNKLDGSSNPLVSIDGLTGDANGLVTLPGDQAANVASKRTLGSGALQAAPGNDTRFPANVVGMVKRNGAGSTDTLALHNVDYLAPGDDGSQLVKVVPFHPTNNAPTVAFDGARAGGITGVVAGSTDVSGTFYFNTVDGGGYSLGAHLATITFGTAPTSAVPARNVLAVAIQGGGTVKASLDAGGASWSLTVGTGIVADTLYYVSYVVSFQ